MGRIMKNEVTKPPVKKVTTSLISKAPTKEELIQRRKESQKFYSQMSLKRARGNVPSKNSDEVSTMMKPLGRDTPKASKIDTEFKSSATSLQMIKSGGIQTDNIGRLSMRSKKKMDMPRVSLLPLGINVFAENTSKADKQKVFDFLKNQGESGKGALFGTPGARKRVVGFNMEESIPESSETISSAIKPKLLNAETVNNTSTQAAPHSILKKKTRLSKASQDYIALGSKEERTGSVSFQQGSKLVFASGSEESGNENEDPILTKVTPAKKSIKFSDMENSSEGNFEELYNFIKKRQHVIEDFTKDQKETLINLFKDTKEYLPELDESNVSLKSLPTDPPAESFLKKDEVRFKSDAFEPRSASKSLRRSLRIGRRDTDSDD